MAVRKVRTGENDPLLRKKAEKVEQITPQIQEVISDMIDTIMGNDMSAGLAAPQIGQSLCIIACREDTSKKPLIIINPEITKKSYRSRTDFESCLSLPGTTVSIKRALKVVVEGQDARGTKMKIKAKGFLARVIQHETDHLEGILISDKGERVS